MSIMKTESLLTTMPALNNTLGVVMIGKTDEITEPYTLILDLGIVITAV